MNESDWFIAKRLARHLKRVVDNIEYSMPPIDDLEKEFCQAEWLLNELREVVREVKRAEANNVVRLVFGTTLPPKGIGDK